MATQGTGAVWRRFGRRVGLLLLVLTVPVGSVQALDGREIISPVLSRQANGAQLVQQMRAAAAQSARYGGYAFAVAQRGTMLYEHYAPGVDPDAPQKLASGTKSFWGPLAVLLASEGRLNLDARVMDVLTSWQQDGRKRQVTVRELLNFTSGLPPGFKSIRAWNKDQYAEGMALPVRRTPGSEFSYGPSHLAVFGAYLQTVMRQDPLTLLQQRILSPLGIRVRDWIRDQEGNPQLAGGGRLSLREWMRFGELIAGDGRFRGRTVIPANWLNQCFQGSRANPAYGLTFWLNAPVPAGGIKSFGGGPTQLVRAPRMFPSLPPSMVMAAGKGGQRLYILRDQDMVVGRLSRGSDRFPEEDILAPIVRPAHSGRQYPMPLPRTPSQAAPQGSQQPFSYPGTVAPAPQPVPTFSPSYNDGPKG